jgi:hypothetical protein
MGFTIEQGTAFLSGVPAFTPVFVIVYLTLCSAFILSSDLDFLRFTDYDYLAGIFKLFL